MTDEKQEWKHVTKKREKGKLKVKWVATERNRLQGKIKKRLRFSYAAIQQKIPVVLWDSWNVLVRIVQLCLTLREKTWAELHIGSTTPKNNADYNILESLDENCFLSSVSFWSQKYPITQCV